MKCPSVEALSAASCKQTNGKTPTIFEGRCSYNETCQTNFETFDSSYYPPFIQYYQKALNLCPGALCYYADRCQASNLTETQQVQDCNLYLQPLGSSGGFCNGEVVCPSWPVPQSIYQHYPCEGQQCGTDANCQVACRGGYCSRKKDCATSDRA